MKLFYRCPIRTWLFRLLCVFSILQGVCLPKAHSYNNYKKESELQESSKPLFTSDEILKLTVLSDFSSIMNDRGEDRSYHKGLLYYLTNERDTIFRKIKLKTRGNFRRDPENCRYPPIMVKFGKLKSADSVFVDQSKLKLVTQCQLEKYVLLEYLAYRIYNLLSPQSYQVRLAHITYADLETKEPYFTRYAFFIENENKLAARINAEIYNPNVVQYFLNKENVITMAMFQYLIGNDDWYVTSKHNVSILKVEENEELVAVPYDFDWSEFVDADYTKPVGVSNHQLRERRVYKGLCLEKVEFERQVSIFNSRKESIIELVESLDDLPRQNKQQSLKYIEKFYKTLNSPTSLRNIFQKGKCIAEPVIQRH